MRVVNISIFLLCGRGFPVLFNRAKTQSGIGFKELSLNAR
jgi:hypothetical protein